MSIHSNTHSGGRAIPIAMIAFALLAVSVGLCDPTGTLKQGPATITAAQLQQEQADFKFGFAHQQVGEPKIRIDPF